MLKKIVFIPEPAGPEERAEVKRALSAFARMGLEGAVLADAPGTRDGTLCLCADGGRLRSLRERGFCAAGYSHGGNRGESFAGAPYVVQEPDLVDADSYQKIYQREAGLPWTIVETPRCLVREFTAGDLDALYGLYDEAACRFLEPPSSDREREGAILRAYIDRIYGLYGFGHWAVLLKPGVGRESAADAARSGAGLAGGENGQAMELVGRIGFSALTAAQEKEAARLGAERPDADFGFLIAPDRRGTGLALEVCSALLEYGFLQLGFTCVRADAHRDNTASQKLLGKLGFVPAGEGRGEKIVFFLRKVA